MRGRAKPKQAKHSNSSLPEAVFESDASAKADTSDSEADSESEPPDGDDENSTPRTFENAIQPGWIISSPLSSPECLQGALAPYDIVKDRYVVVRLADGWHFAKVYQKGIGKHDKGIIYILVTGADSAGSFDFSYDMYLRTDDYGDAAVGSWLFVEEAYLGRRHARG